VEDRYLILTEVPEMEKDRVSFDICDVVCMLYDSSETKEYLHAEIEHLIPNHIPKMLVKSKVEIVEIDDRRFISVAHQRPDTIYKEILGFCI
jgi:hypothetical protein